MLLPVPRTTSTKTRHSLDFAGPVEALMAGVDVHTEAKSAFMAAAFATAIGSEFAEQKTGVNVLFYDATLFHRHRGKNLAPHEIYDSLDHCFDTCHAIIWANLSYIGMDLARDLDTVLQRRFSAGLSNIVSGWTPPRVVVEVKDQTLANMANPYPLLHERSCDARMMYRCELKEKA